MRLENLEVIINRVNRIKKLEKEVAMLANQVELLKRDGFQLKDATIQLSVEDTKAIILSKRKEIETIKKELEQY